MLNPNDEAKLLSDNKVTLAQCPGCNGYSLHLFYMEDAYTKQKSKWHSCSCGLLFQDSWDIPVYDQKYIDKLPLGKKYDDSCKYLVRILAPIIEESMYGRKMLMVGKNDPMLEEFRDRGWVSYCIDSNKVTRDTHRIISGDFETHSFVEGTQYNLIWLYHILEGFNDPFYTLEKATSLLAEDGILYIGTPDSDFLHVRGPAGFRGWKKDYNHILWNKRCLTSYLEKLGYEIVLTKRNYEPRFPYQDDLWLVAQKKYY